MLCFHKNRGAISVFLVIILVPCMLIASIFVDISRVQLSRAVAESSADLALSTLMSNYDYDLNEYYGLMGSCQNISEYYAVAAECYDVSLHSRDLDNEEVQLLYQRVMKDVGDRFGNETVSDLLRVQNQTQGAMISPLEDADMYNATILQEQIVEFMKYRGPIVIGQEIIEKINGDPGVSEMLDSDKNKPIVDDKIEFYEAEGELLQKAFDVYWDTRAYTDKVGDNGENMSAGKLREYVESLREYRAAYQEVHGYLVSNLTNTQNLTGAYSRVTMELDVHKDEYDKTSAEIYSRKETPTPSPAPSSSPAPAASSTPEPVYYIDGDKVTSLLNGLETARNDFVTAKNDYITACGSLPDTPPGTGDSDAHAVQWWVRMDNAVNASAGVNYTDELRNKADAMLDAYAKVLAIKDCEPGNDMPAGWEAEWEKQVNDTRSVHGQYLVANITNDTDKYLKAVTLLEQVSAANTDRIRPTGLYVTVDGQSRTLEAAVGHIRSRLDEMQRDVDVYIGLLDKVIGGSPSEIDNLRSLAQKYNTKLNEWDGSVSAATGLTGKSNLAGEHRKEIDAIRATGSEPLDNTAGGAALADASDEASTKICLSIDAAAVDAMKTRLTRIRSQYQTLHDAIEGMQYGSQRLLDIANMSTVKTCSQTVVSASAIGLTNGEVNSYAASTFPQLFQPAEGDIAALHGMEGGGDNASYNPLMSPVTEQIDTPDLYIYMHGKFKDTSQDAVEDKKAEQEDAKNKGDEAADKAKDANRYHGGGTDITPTDLSEGDGFSLGDGLIGGLVGIVKALSSGKVDNIRDDLYATTYMMEMFSYATFENEGYYNSVLSEEERKDLSLREGNANYYRTVYSRHEGSEQDEGTWRSAKPQNAYNKTLTNRLINRENNAAYLAEVEYILYGKATNVDNVKAAYGDIYAIRYALNLISAFANFWSRGNTTANVINDIADGIMSVTAGVIPAAVTKVILLPILTIFETCKDMDRLEAGFPVELYKQEGDWWYSLPSDAKNISDFMKVFSGDTDKGNSGKGVQYSDYLTLFVYLGLQSEDQGSEKMYLRMADVIQANMRKATDNTEYALTNTQVYFRLKAKLRVEPLMLTLPYYTDYVNDPSMKDDWCTFEVETIRGY